MQRSFLMAFKQTRAVLLAAAIAVGGASYALAQSAPAPANQSGGVNATPGTNTDPGMAGESGNTKGTPALKSRKNGHRMTTGSGTSHSGMKPAKREPARNSMEKTTSPPGSGNAGSSPAR
ncbi:MAG TPA: hypothetical protein VNQ56_15375 [Pseudolabrys sp.]|nr:hypothetical protein [Pseudolabrys sp.]